MLPVRGRCHLAVAQAWLAPRPAHRDLNAGPRDCRATGPAEACGNGCADVRREDRIVTTAADALAAVWPDVKIEAGDYGTAVGWIDRFYAPPGLVQLLQSWQTAVTAALTSSAIQRSSRLLTCRALTACPARPTSPCMLDCSRRTESPSGRSR
jgi:hypothetical protein